MILFVGEKPSLTAHRNGWTWESGRLAGASLAAALSACGLDSTDYKFLNLFGDTPEAIEQPATGRLAEINVQHTNGLKIVALGSKVAKHLQAAGVPHARLVHPAARGKIRGRAIYAQHVADVLTTMR